MAENIPHAPGGAVPPKKETGKVQPKKETVRINLPPKPSAAPTIKLPTLPPGGPAGGSPGAPAPAAPVAATNAHAAPPAPRAVAAPAAPGASRPMPVAAAAPRPVASPIAVRSISTVDKVLAIAAAIVALAAVGSTVYIWMLELPGSSSGATPEKAAASTVHVAMSDGPR